MIGSRLVLLVCGAIAFALLAAGCGGSDGSDDAQQQAESISNDIDGVLATGRDELAKVAKLPEVKGGNAKQCSAAMKAQEKSKPEGFGSLGAASADGTLDCLSIPIDAPIDIADRVYFVRAIGTNDLGVGDYQIGRATGLQSIGLGYPVDGASKGGYAMVLTVLDLDFLRDRLAHELDPDVADLLVIDDHGTVLSRVGDVKTPTGENLGTDELVVAMLADNDGSGEYPSDAGTLDYNFTSVPASGNEIHVAVGLHP